MHCVEDLFCRVGHGSLTVRVEVPDFGSCNTKKFLRSGSGRLCCGYQPNNGAMTVLLQETSAFCGCFERLSISSTSLGVSQVKGIFGFTNDDNIGKIGFPPVQVRKYGD